MRYPELRQGCSRLRWIGAFLGSVALLGALLIGSRVWAGVPIQTWRLDNGARVLFVHRPSLPMVTLRAQFAAGSAYDPPGKYGLAALTAAMLDEGAGELSAGEFARAVDSLGARFTTSKDRDRLTIQVTSLSESDLLRRAWELLALALNRPAFASEALERERRRLLTSIQRDREKPRVVALKAFYRAVYGDHPYAHPTDGTPEGLHAIRSQDLGRFASRYFVGHNATIAVVGDIEEEAARTLLSNTLGRLPAGKAATALPEVAALQSQQRVVVQRPVSQTHILIGQPGTSRGASDYFPLLVGNYSLGSGGFSSRLVSAIREEHGLSYSVFSTFRPLSRQGPFIAGLQTSNEHWEEALDLLRAEIEQFVAKGPRPEEVEAAHRFLTGSFPLRIASNQDIVNYLAMIGFYDLGVGYLDRFPQRVRATTPEQIHRAMQAQLDPERMVTVLVGQTVQGNDKEGRE